MQIEGNMQANGPNLFLVEPLKCAHTALWIRLPLHYSRQLCQFEGNYG